LLAFGVKICISNIKATYSILSLVSSKVVELKKLLHIKGNSYKTEGTAHRMEENFCQVCICQGVNNKNKPETQKTKLSKSQQPNEEMGK
jgi:hypothetical protein